MAVHKLIKKQAMTVEQLAVLAGKMIVSIGNTEASIFAQQQSTQEMVEQQLIELKNNGFTVEMLSKKHACRVEMEKQLALSYITGRSAEYRAYLQQCVADSKEPEFPDEHWFKARKLDIIAVPDSTRYNRFSAIRKWFEESNGKKLAKLDLYNNAVKKAKGENAKAKKPASTATVTEEQGKAVTNQVRPNLKGIAPLQQFVLAWVEENQSVAGLQKYINPMKELLQAIEADAPKK